MGALTAAAPALLAAVLFGALAIISGAVVLSWRTGIRTIRTFTIGTGISMASQNQTIQEPLPCYDRCHASIR
jgi:hypothetical protein